MRRAARLARANCSLIAEFVARRYLNRGVSWKKVVMAKPDGEINAKTTTPPFKKDGVLHLAATKSTAHELCVIRDHDYTALLHAWAGYVEVFPRLNIGFTYNVHGPGSDGEARVLRALTTGQPIRGDGPVMPTSWAVVRSSGAGISGCRNNRRAPHDDTALLSEAYVFTRSVAQSSDRRRLRGARGASLP